MLLYRHILRAHIGPFLFAFATLMFIFMLQFLMKYIDHLAGKGLGAWIIAQLIIYNLAWMVVLAVPMAILVATLMAFGNMSANNEITAMKASGVSFLRMTAPVVVASALIAYLLIEFNNKVLPDANHKAKVLGIDIQRKKRTLALEAGLFSQEIDGYSILVRKTFEHSNDLENVTIYDCTNPNESVIVTARQGSVHFSPDYRKMIMDLQDGEIHQMVASDMKEYRKIQFSRHRIMMNAEQFEFQRSAESAFSRGDRELSAQTMLKFVDSLKEVNHEIERSVATMMNKHVDNYLARNPSNVPSPAAVVTPWGGNVIDRALMEARLLAGSIEAEVSRLEFNDKSIDRYTVEVHKKYAIPFACIVFVLVGAPLGVMARRGGFGVAAGLSLGFFLIYWACLIGGEKLADRDIMSPFIGMWMANIVLGAIGIYLTIRTLKETVVIDWTQLQRFVPKRFRGQETILEEGTPRLG